MTSSKLRTKFAILLIIPCIAFSAVIVIMSNSYLKQFLNSMQQDSLEKMSNQILYSLQNSVQSVEDLLLNIQKNGIVGGKTDKLENVISIIYKYKSNYIKGIVYIGKDGTVTGFPTTYWYFGKKEISIINSMVAKSPRGISWSSHFYSTLDNSSEQYQPLSIAILPVYYGKSYIGVLGIVISLTEFLSNTTLYDGNYDITTYLYENNGRLADNMEYKSGTNYFLSPSNASAEKLQNLKTAFGYLLSNNMYYACSKMDESPQWSIIVAGNAGKLAMKFQPFNAKIIIVIIIGFAGLLIMYLVFIQFWFTVPMSRLSKGIRHVSGGDFDYMIDMRRNDEFGEVAEEFNHMSQMIKNLITELQVANEKRTESDLNVLLSQINPHFLYNTLDAIDIMVDVSPKEKVHEAFRKLVVLLQYGLDRNQLRKLDEELNYIRNYVDLLKIRYGDSFNCIIEEGEGTGKIKILKLLLQPLVENAVFHGFQPLKVRKGVLLIKTWLDGDYLKIKVSDNGVGMPERMLKNILNAKQTGNITGGIGLANVYERIRLYCSSGYDFDVKSVEGEGTDIVIKLSAKNKGPIS